MLKVPKSTFVDLGFFAFYRVNENWAHFLSFGSINWEFFRETKLKAEIFVEEFIWPVIRT